MLGEFDVESIHPRCGPGEEFLGRYEWTEDRMNG